MGMSGTVKKDTQRSRVVDFLRGAAEGFDGLSEPMPRLSTGDALNRDLEVISRDMLRCALRIGDATVRRPRK